MSQLIEFDCSAVAKDALIQFIREVAGSDHRVMSKSLVGLPAEAHNRILPALGNWVLSHNTLGPSAAFSGRAEKAGEALSGLLAALRGEDQDKLQQALRYFRAAAIRAISILLTPEPEIDHAEHIKRLDSAIAMARILLIAQRPLIPKIAELRAAADELHAACQVACGDGEIMQTLGWNISLNAGSASDTSEPGVFGVISDFAMNIMSDSIELKDAAQLNSLVEKIALRLQQMGVAVQPLLNHPSWKEIQAALIEIAATITIQNASLAASVLSLAKHASRIPGYIERQITCGIRANEVKTLADELADAVRDVGSANIHDAVADFARQWNEIDPNASWELKEAFQGFLNEQLKLHADAQLAAMRAHAENIWGSALREGSILIVTVSGEDDDPGDEEKLNLLLDLGFHQEGQTDALVILFTKQKTIAICCDPAKVDAAALELFLARRSDAATQWPTRFKISDGEGLSAELNNLPEAKSIEALHHALEADGLDNLSIYVLGGAALYVTIDGGTAVLRWLVNEINNLVATTQLPASKLD